MLLAIEQGKWNQERKKLRAQGIPDTLTTELWHGEKVIERRQVPRPETPAEMAILKRIWHLERLLDKD